MRPDKKMGNVTMIKFGVLVIASLALLPDVARAEAFDLNCTTLDAQGQPQGAARRFHIDRDAARWCGGVCDPDNTITSDDGKTLTLGLPAAGGGLTSRSTYDIESRILLVEIEVGGVARSTRSRCEVEPFSGFVSDFTTDPRPENLRALLAIRPLTDADGRSIPGRVGIELVIDERGRITGCSTRASSGNADLDRHACQQASELLKMRPATDIAGKPVEGRFSTTIAFPGG